MKLSDIQKRLQVPFPTHLINFKPASFNQGRSRALLLAYIDARAVQDRLDATCPDGWSFELELVTGAAHPTVKGRLTVLGVVREDIGEGAEGELGTLKAAASDAFKRCAVQFGIGRYLYDLPCLNCGPTGMTRNVPPSTPPNCRSGPGRITSAAPAGHT